MTLIEELKQVSKTKKNAIPLLEYAYSQAVKTEITREQLALEETRMIIHLFDWAIAALESYQGKVVIDADNSIESYRRAYEAGADSVRQGKVVIDNEWIDSNATHSANCRGIYVVPVSKLRDAMKEAQ